MDRPTLQSASVAALLFLIPFSTAFADDPPPWTGQVSVAVVGRDVRGSEASFRSQSDLRSGFVLDDLSLSRSGFSLTASGFGNAEPSRRARAEMHFRSPLTLTLSYDRRASFFAIQDSTVGPRRDDWSIERWNLRAAWDGWSAGKVSLNLRRTAREGSAVRTFFGLNEIYPLALALDEKTDEATLRLDTRGYPLQFSFEQSFAHQQRRDRSAPAAAGALGAADPDTLVAALNDRSDRQNVPTSRAVATYASERVEGKASVLYAPARLSATIPTTATFGVNGGAAGNVSFVDTVASSATRDARAGTAAFTVRMAPRWSVSLSGDYRDASTDGALLGQRLVRMTNPNGSAIDLTTPLDGASVLDFTDAGERLEIQRSGDHLTLRAGVLASQRRVNGVDRHSSGGSVGLSWRGGRLTAGADAEHGTFSHTIFRTDPETVDRLRLRAALPLGRGWSVQSDGRFERGENGRDVAALRHRSNSGALDLTWAPAGSEASAGVDIASTSLSTRTDLMLPGGAAGVSRYDLSLLTATLHGRLPVGRVVVAGAATRTRDNGSTWPVAAWSANARASVRVSPRADFALFGERWIYDERRAVADDFHVWRYGVALTWRFE